jgi:16S rRNA (cytosine967-C5)-methyltransferase
VHVLEAILVGRQPLERAIEGQADHLGRLEERDRGLALAIVRTTLRRLLFLSAVIDRLLERPLPAEARRVRMILLAGAAQLLLLDTPAHAAVDVAVEQCRHDRAASRFDKLVNAVLRRVREASVAVLQSWDSPEDDIPAWLLARWTATYGAADARRIAAASLERAALDITPRRDAANWAQVLGADLLPTGSLRLTQAGAVPDLSGYIGDAWWVQDAAAALPARLLGDVRGLSVADLCAAPGGKTAQLAAAGARVTAVDVSAARLARLAENLARLGLSDHVALVAATVEDFRPADPFDAVLLDAPCTATGTLRRHPDILHLKTPEDVSRLAATQACLLAHAAALVRPGGTLVYCTCSLEPEEGPQQVDRFLAGRPEFSRRPLPTAAIGADPAWFTPDGDLRTLPFHMPRPAPSASGMDGFYAARLVRRSA